MLVFAYVHVPLVAITLELVAHSDCASHRLRVTLTLARVSPIVLVLPYLAHVIHHSAASIVSSIPSRSSGSV
jgi:hypothetical protein